MKKLVFIFIGLVLCISVVGCGNKTIVKGEGGSELTESKNELVYIDTDGVSKVVYSFKNDQISNVVVTTAFDTEEEASAYSTSITAYLNTMYNNIDVKKNKVIVTYTNEYMNSLYGSYTKEQLKEVLKSSVDYWG